LFAPDTEPLTRREEHAATILAGRLLAVPRTDPPRYTGPDTLTGTPESTGEHRLNDFQASLVDLAGGVRVARRRQAGRRAARAEALLVPEFVPDPVCRAAVAEGVLRPGSDADQAVSAEVDAFVRDGPGPDPAGPAGGGPDPAGPEIGGPDPAEPEFGDLENEEDR
jgi:hypothetical protein